MAEAAAAITISEATLEMINARATAQYEEWKANATAEQKAAAKDAAVNYTRDGCLHILEFKKNPVGYGDPMDPMFIAAIRAIYM